MRCEVIARTVCANKFSILYYAKEINISCQLQQLPSYIPNYALGLPIIEVYTFKQLSYLSCFQFITKKIILKSVPKDPTIFYSQISVYKKKISNIENIIDNVLSCNTWSQTGLWSELELS